jgi:hypothetical protein
MPRNPKGELNLTEIRNLVRQHNKLTAITGVDTKSRKGLIEEIEGKGYRVDHAGKRLVRRSGKGRLTKKIQVGEKGERKPNITTKKKVERQRIKDTAVATGSDTKKKLKGRLTGVQKALDAKEKRRKDLIAGK